MAEKAATEAGGEVYTLGPLIHNPQVVEKLHKQGVKLTGEIEGLPPGSVLILRSHGVGPSVYALAEKAGLKIIDATCPNVKKVQKLAVELRDKGYCLVILGEKHHPEIESIIETVNNEAHVVEGVKEAEGISCGKRIGLIAQTTQTLANLESLAAFLIKRVEELRVYNTLCDAVSQRQTASLDLAGKVDLMLVVGGYNSANTTRLARICHQAGCETHHVEVAAQIDPAWFRDKRKVGITAGASTPPWIIDEVREAVASL